LISKKDIECIREKVLNTIIDDTIAIGEIKQFFTADEWTAVQQIIKIKKLNSTWFCLICSEDASKKSIFCNRCLEWSHFICIRVK